METDPPPSKMKAQAGEKQTKQNKTQQNPPP
jgi:hypothetical protein